MTDRVMGQADLTEFVRGSIRSVWALRVLLLLRESPGRAWSAAELVVELRASDGVVMSVLSGFERDGLVARAPENRFRFASEVGDRINALCDALAAAYRERPVAVMTAIATREDRLGAFAEAFRLRDRHR